MRQAEGDGGGVGEELRQAAEGRSERTPLIVLVGVTFVVGTLVGLVTLATVLAILLAG